ncbi:hypothetical protein [Planococcus sp. CAU13]|uniref:hypothetical protein n=1 Tax=Planococcus sp. CAU13 TaxID=1541197 RepID=UPI00052FFD65|nr:hypothetical protein [Planococcus sp. CAU13]
MKKTLMVLIILLAGTLYYINTENKQTSFAELSAATVKPEEGIHTITLNRYVGGSTTPEGYAEITDPAEIEKFLATASKTDLKGSKDFPGQKGMTYSIHFLHYTESLSVMTDGQITMIDNTRFDVLKDDNPADFAPFYEINGTDYFSEAVAEADIAWE